MINSGFRVPNKVGLILRQVGFVAPERSKEVFHEVCCKEGLLGMPSVDNFLKGLRHPSRKPSQAPPCLIVALQQQTARSSIIIDDHHQVSVQA